MIALANYRLLDFGAGRKLEEFGGYVIDRPSPAAASATPQHPVHWRSADARFTGKTWLFNTRPPADLVLECGLFRLPIDLKPFGHVGVFPEQRENWQWLHESARSWPSPPAALNLFAYTGGSTLALAAAGATVAHVDAAKPNVQAARAAAAISALSDAPIRYLVEDAATFVGREVRRGRRYPFIVLDPPAYGHGPTGDAWRLDRDLWPLLENLLQLSADGDSVWVITGHSQSPAAADVLRWLSERLGARLIQHALGPMELRCVDGRSLNAGWYLRLRINHEGTKKQDLN